LEVFIREHHPRGVYFVSKDDPQIGSRRVVIDDCALKWLKICHFITIPEIASRSVQYVAGIVRPERHVREILTG
jgi:hypothetical protein